MFDSYTLKARFYPIVILFFPIIVIGLFYSIQFNEVIHFATSLGIVGALTYLFSQLGRDKGKIKEPTLWASWGGSPTTQLLRLKDLKIDRHTKIRYHNKLQLLCPTTLIPTDDLEVSQPVEVDAVYKSWTQYLISKTRDTSLYPLLLKENTSYGFRRNLWGLKNIAIVSIIIILVGNYMFWVTRMKVGNLFLFPNSYFYSSATLVILLLFWIFVVNKKWIKIPAFSYAERLCETIENLKPEESR